MNVQLTAITQSRIVVGDDFGHEVQMTPEEYIIWCARVSTEGKRVNNETAPKLLRYLTDNKHWSPFEMVSIAFQIETSRAIAQQILRHRSFSFQEFSQRYAKVNAFEEIELRRQADKNRQSSTTPISNRAPNQQMVDRHIEYAQEVYEDLLEAGVAKECARMVLPLCTQTTIVMHGTLRSWIHFFEQRCSPHAQKEIQDIAFEIRARLSVKFPWTATALEWD